MIGLDPDHKLDHVILGPSGLYAVLSEDVGGPIRLRRGELIGDGVVDREGVDGLASRLGYSVRQVQRLTLDELGATPLSLARVQRAHTARILLTTTALPLAEVAFAAGFGSIRTFNDTVAQVYAATPSALRGRAREGGHTDSGLLELRLRLAFRAPFDPSNVFGHLAATAVPGVEEWRDGAYRRTLRLPHGPGFVALAPRADHVAARLHLSDPRDLTPALGRCRRLLDLDAELGGDLALLGAAVVDRLELAVRPVDRARLRAHGLIYN